MDEHSTLIIPAGKEHSRVSNAATITVECSILRKLLLLSFFLLFYAAAVVGILLTRTKEHYLQNTNAILAYTSVITFLVVTIPCSCRFLPYEKLVGLDYLWVVHKRSVMVVLVTGVLHAFFTMRFQSGTLPRTLPLLWIDVKRALVPGQLPPSPFSKKANIGIWLVYIMVFGGLTAAVRRVTGNGRWRRILSLPYKIWWPIHLLLWVTVPMAIIHSKPHKHVWKGKHEATSTILAILTVFAAIVIIYRVVQLIHNRLLFAEWFRIKSVTAINAKDTELVLSRPYWLGIPFTGFARFRPGQFAIVQAPAFPFLPFINDPYPLSVAGCSIITNEAGKRSVRLSLVIRRTRVGRFSRDVAMYPIGKLLRVHGPYGTMTPDPASTPCVLVAAGNGIVPFIPVIEALTIDTCPVTLMWSVRSSDVAPLLDKLAAKAEAVAQFNIHLTLTRPDLEGATPIPDVVEVGQGRLELRHYKAAVSTGGVSAYFCGSADFVKQQRAVVRRLGVPFFRMHSEHYSI